MGFAKEQQMEAQHRGYYWIGEGKAVCGQCVQDADLRRFIEEQEGELACTYCERSASEAHAIDIDVFLDEVASALSEEWEPVDGQYFDSDRGDWMVETWSTEDLFLMEIEEWPFANDELAKDIIGAFTTEEWSRVDPMALSTDEALAAGWRSFSEAVRHKTRYLYFEEHPWYDDAVPPAEILRRIHELVDEQDLVRELPADTKLSRARHSFQGSAFKTASELGAPSPDQARASSRMSAAGIPVFYGALDLETAIAETLAHAGAGGRKSEVQVSWGVFVTARPMLVLDLTTLPQVPGIFDSSRRRSRASLRFLWQFRDEMAKPIPPDGREHYEYAPTQVVTEYFRHVYRTVDGRPLDGVLYPSSQQTGTSCVFFFSAGDCGELGAAGSQLALDPSTVGSRRYRVTWDPVE